VATVCSWHEHHARTLAELERRERAGEALVLAAHSLAETYAVLTRLRGPNRLRSGDAIALLEANWSETPVVHLTAAETWRALRSGRRRGVIGCPTCAMLIATCALKADAGTILAWDGRHFVAAAAEIAVETPA